MDSNSKKFSVPGVIKAALREVIIPIACALVVIQYVIQAFQIPSGSMEDTLLTGDFILGLKFTYGSPVPFTHSKFPGLTDPKVGDVVIFRYPGEPAYPDYDYKRYSHLADALMFGNFYWDSKPLPGNPHLVHFADGPKDFIKRCVAVSGDTIEVSQGVLSQNGVKNPIPGKGKYTAYYRTGVARDSLEKIQVPVPGEKIDLTSLSLPRLWWIRSLMMQENPEQKVELELNLYKDSVKVDDFLFEKFRVPVENDRGLLLNAVMSQGQIVGMGLRQGDTVEGPAKFALFKQLARTGFLPRFNPNGHYSGMTRPVSYDYFEGSQLGDLAYNVSLDSTLHLEANILVDGEKTKEYTVQYPVYFMMGDNRDNSADSRYWGFVSKRNIKAKAFVVYFSFDNADGSFSFGNPFSWFKIPFQIRWTRIGKIIHMIGE
jgi:signal peptidase I